MNKLPSTVLSGIGPLPLEAPDRLHLPGIRLWGIARELARAGHGVRVASVRYTGEAFDRIYVCEIEAGSEAASSTREVAFAPGGLAAALEREAREFGARAVVGCMDVINRELGKIESPLPIWMDYPGDPMAERQQLARVWQSDAQLADQWQTLAQGLARADRVSGFSEEAAGALAGEMSALGRLNRWTALEPVIFSIPPWFEPIAVGPESVPVVRGALVPQDAFVVLHSGGFNTWLDEETLFAALELAMRERPAIHFVATGGPIKGHNEGTFERFAAMIAASPLRERFHLLGWVSLSKARAAIREADLGLNVDRPGNEGWLGGRYRLIDWMGEGLPIASTVGCEFAEAAAARGLIESAPQRDARALADSILRAAADPAAARRRAESARAWLAERFAPERVLRPLLDWARHPKPAADLAAWRAGQAAPPALWSQAERADRLAESENLAREAAEAEARLAQLEGSSIVRAALRLRAIRQRKL